MADRNPEIKYKKLFINNEFVDGKNRKSFPVINPTTGEKIVEVAEGDKEDIDIAVAAAKVAFQPNSPWRKMDASKRGELIMKLSDLLKRDAASLASILTLENGKPFTLATFEITAAANALRYFAGWCDKIVGKTIPSDGLFFTYTLKEPVGVVGLIVPWNFPVMLAVMKVGACLATGCVCVLKPAEQTPLNALCIGALVKEAGFPPGVVNIVNGYGPTAGAALSAHMDVAKVAFTGSTQVGHIIMEQAAKSNLKRISLELGGKSPLVVFEDADLDQAVDIAHEALFMNQGQICTSGTRAFVHESIYNEFVKKAAAKAAQRKVGDPFEASTQHGPQIDEEMFTKVMTLIESGKKEGAKLETGGKRVGIKGYFIEPTVFSEVTDNMRIAKEEIFGPVQQIIKFSTLEEVIQRANNTNYGLAAGIITKDINKALTFAQAAQAGNVWINCYNAMSAQAPFGGYKESGFGKDMGEEALNDYYNIKTVSIRMP